MVSQCPKLVVPIIGSTAEDFTMIPMLILLTAKYTTHSTWLVGLARKVLNKTFVSRQVKTSLKTGHKEDTAFYNTRLAQLDSLPAQFVGVQRVPISKTQVSMEKKLKDTTINYCCSATGELTNAISLPLDKPFYLYSMSGTRCQQVKGATVKEEAVIFDKNAGRYQINTEGDNPFQMVKNGAQMKLTYCYYTPGGTVGIPESQEVEKTLFTGAELDNKTQSSGLAVAIGIGIACAMVGTASIALVTKKLMRKKKDDDDDDDEPRPDDP